MGKEAWAVGENLRKVGRKHNSLKGFVCFQYMGSGSNMQWVYVVQAKADAQKIDTVPIYWNGILDGINLEMMERPKLLEPPVVAEQWEVTTVTCLLDRKEAEGDLVGSFCRTC